MASWAVFISAYAFRLPYLYPYTRWTIASWQYQHELLPNPLPNQRFADTWGAARSFGRKHEGVDIFAKRGTVIGTVGDTGNAKGTPPHLHYGIYTKTGAINPFPLIKQ